MGTVTTAEAAAHMMHTGKGYTASMLSKELNIGLGIASGKLFNIKTSPNKYCIKLSKSSPVKVTVLDIDGQEKKAQLWKQVLQS